MVTNALIKSWDEQHAVHASFQATSALPPALATASRDLGPLFAVPYLIGSRSEGVIHFLIGLRGLPTINACEVLPVKTHAIAKGDVLLLSVVPIRIPQQ